MDSRTQTGEEKKLHKALVPGTYIDKAKNERQATQTKTKNSNKILQGKNRNKNLRLERKQEKKKNRQRTPKKARVELPAGEYKQRRSYCHATTAATAFLFKRDI